MTTKGIKIDMVGRKYGRLTVVSFSHRTDKRRTIWSCICDCGGNSLSDGANLRNGNTQSCGCYRRDKTIDAHISHGLTGTRTHNVWWAMIQRCSNKNGVYFCDYGGRGISVCERWHKFENFLSDMGEAPPSLTIDRIDNDGNYEPGNCRWATRKQQVRNRRKSKRVTVFGKDMLFVEACELYGIEYKRAFARITKLGWSPERTFTRG